MKFENLIDFIENKMRMSHIYQPLFIMSLIEADGKATIRQLAKQFLIRDESQLKYYGDRIKKMPLRVLRNHEIVSSDNDVVSINMRKLTFKEKAKIRMLCEQKIQEFIERRGLSIWDYRLLESNPIPDSLYYRVIKESDGRCVACGATKKDRMLHVDHIKPKSKGGKNEYENLQVLCSKCNQAKSNKDDFDFRKFDPNESNDTCKFCYNNIKSRIIYSFDTVFAMKDGYPVSEGHKLIVPYRHSKDYFTMTNKEKNDADNLIKILQKNLLGKDSTITGFNIGMNNGESAGQTIFHAHIHLIPRRDGDIENPKGGVRGVIPEKMGY